MSVADDHFCGVFNGPKQRISIHPHALQGSTLYNTAAARHSSRSVGAQRRKVICHRPQLR